MQLLKRPIVATTLATFQTLLYQASSSSLADVALVEEAAVA